MLQEKGLVIMRAPPRSGKTSLCQLVAFMAKDSNMFQQVFYLSCAAVNDDCCCCHISFQILFRTMCKLRELTMPQHVYGAGPSKFSTHPPTQSGS